MWPSSRNAVDHFRCVSTLRRSGRTHPGYRHAVQNDDERIALFLDYENLAIGARDGLGVAPFDFAPIADALAERGGW